jgi:hypothetical protein
MAKRLEATPLTLEQIALLSSTVTAINAELKGKGVIAMAWFIRCYTGKPECSYLVVTGAGSKRQFKVVPQEKENADSIAVAIHRSLYCKH